VSRISSNAGLEAEEDVGVVKDDGRERGRSGRAFQISAFQNIHDTPPMAYLRS